MSAENHAPIFYTTYLDGYYHALAQLNITNSFNNWQISEAFNDNVTDQNWALFHPYCVKDNKAATLANLHAQGWPLWSKASRIGSFAVFDSYWQVHPYNITKCDYDSSEDANYITLYYDFIPFRYMPEGIGTYLW